MTEGRIFVWKENAKYHISITGENIFSVCYRLVNRIWFECSFNNIQLRHIFCLLRPIAITCQAQT